MKNSGGNIADRARRLGEPIAEKLGLTFWDVRFVKEGAQWYLRYFIEKPDGVSITDCENFSRAIDGPLDDEDFIDHSYCLEVSSPGLGRRLTRDEHFEAMQGREVTVHLNHPQNNQRDFIGTLNGLENGNIVISSDEGEILSFQQGSVSYVKLNDDIFD